MATLTSHVSASVSDGAVQRWSTPDPVNSKSESCIEIVRRQTITQSKSQTLQLYSVWICIAVGACYLFHLALKESDAFLDIDAKLADDVAAVAKMSSAVDKMGKQLNRIHDVDVRLSVLDKAFANQDRVTRELSRDIEELQATQEERRNGNELLLKDSFASRPGDEIPHGDGVLSGGRADQPLPGNKTYVTAVVDNGTLPIEAAAVAEVNRRKHRKNNVDTKPISRGR